jgi:hypothetical protein
MHVEAMRKIENLIQDRQLHSQESTPTIPECEAEVITTQPLYLLNELLINTKIIMRTYVLSA